jgi:hypothetical protein
MTVSAGSRWRLPIENAKLLLASNPAEATAVERMNVLLFFIL